MLEAIQNAYSVLDRLQFSMTQLLVITVIFSLTFIFAVREATSWFLKVDSLKKEMKKLNRTTAQLEADIKEVKALLLANSTTQQADARESGLAPEGFTLSSEPAAKNKTGSTPEPVSKVTLAKASQEKTSGYSINH